MARKHRRKRPTPAPISPPDPAIQAAIRANDVYDLPTRQCRRCHQPLPRQAYTATEWAKLSPTCTACASAPIRTATALPQTDPPSRPLAPHLAYRMRVAEEDEFEAHMRFAEQQEKDHPFDPSED